MQLETPLCFYKPHEAVLLVHTYLEAARADLSRTDVGYLPTVVPSTFRSYGIAVGNSREAGRG
jgi:hypothetical protein